MLDVEEVIMRYVQQNGKVTSKQIIEHTGLPRSTVLKEISKLTNAGKLDAFGKPPREVLYQLAQTLTQEVPADKLIEPPPAPPKTAPAPQKPPDPPMADPEGGSPGPDQPDSSQATTHDPVIRWCGRAKVNPQSVINWHHKFYKEAFKFPYGVYETPHGLWGELLDVALWVLAFGLVWCWKTKAGIIVVLLLIGVIFVGYHFFNQHGPTRTENKDMVARLDYEQAQLKISQLEEQGKTTQEQLDKAQADAQKLDQQNNQLAQDKEQLSHQLQQEQDKVKQLENQIQQVGSRPVDYEAVIQHPFTSNESINFFKGLFHKPKAAVAQQVVSPPNVSVGGPGLATSRSPTKALGDDKAVKQWQEQLSQAQSQIDQLQNQIKQLQEQLKSIMATSEATKQSNEKEMASQKALVLTQKDQIEHLTQENKRLNEKYLNEEVVSANLESQLKAALANSKDASDEQDTSILFDAKGERVK